VPPPPQALHAIPHLAADFRLECLQEGPGESHTRCWAPSSGSTSRSGISSSTCQCHREHRHRGEGGGGGAQRAWVEALPGPGSGSSTCQRHREHTTGGGCRDTESTSQRAALGGPEEALPGPGSAAPPGSATGSTPPGGRGDGGAQKKHRKKHFQVSMEWREWEGEQESGKDSVREASTSAAEGSRCPGLLCLPLGSCRGAGAPGKEHPQGPCVLPCLGTSRGSARPCPPEAETEIGTEAETETEKRQGQGLGQGQGQEENRKGRRKREERAESRGRQRQGEESAACGPQEHTVLPAAALCRRLCASCGPHSQWPWCPCVAEGGGGRASLANGRGQVPRKHAAHSAARGTQQTVQYCSLCLSNK